MELSITKPLHQIDPFEGCGVSTTSSSVNSEMVNDVNSGVVIIQFASSGCAVQKHTESALEYVSHAGIVMQLAFAGFAVQKQTESAFENVSHVGLSPSSSPPHERRADAKRLQKMSE